MKIGYYYVSKGQTLLKRNLPNLSHAPIDIIPVGSASFLTLYVGS